MPPYPKRSGTRRHKVIATRVPGSGYYPRAVAERQWHDHDTARPTREPGVCDSFRDATNGAPPRFAAHSRIRENCHGPCLRRLHVARKGEPSGRANSPPFASGRPQDLRGIHWRRLRQPVIRGELTRYRTLPGSEPCHSRWWESLRISLETLVRSGSGYAAERDPDAASIGRTLPGGATGEDRLRRRGRPPRPGAAGVVGANLFARVQGS